MSVLFLVISEECPNHPFFTNLIIQKAQESPFVFVDNQIYEFVKISEK